VDDATHTADQVKFDEIEQISRSGPALQRAIVPRVPSESTSGAPARSLNWRRPPCPAAIPESEIPCPRRRISRAHFGERPRICPKRLPSRKFRTRSRFGIFALPRFLNVLGDGFVEAVPDRLCDLPRSMQEKLKRFAQVLRSILEAPADGVAFRLEKPHASCFLFADAYLNEMASPAASSRRVTNLCTPSASQ